MSTKRTRTSKKKPAVSHALKSVATSDKRRAEQLLSEVRELILNTRQTVARGVNAALTMLYWQVGDHVRKAILREQRAEYGKQILVTLSQELLDRHERQPGEEAPLGLILCAGKSQERIELSLSRRDTSN